MRDHPVEGPASMEREQRDRRTTAELRGPRARPSRACRRRGSVDLASAMSGAERRRGRQDAAQVVLLLDRPDQVQRRPGLAHPCLREREQRRASRAIVHGRARDAAARQVEDTWQVDDGRADPDTCRLCLVPGGEARVDGELVRTARPGTSPRVPWRGGSCSRSRRAGLPPPCTAAPPARAAHVPGRRPGAPAG